MEDDYVCEYDSTWDTESDGDDPAGESQSRRSNQDKNKSSWAIWHHTPRNMRAAKDMQNYRRGYPNLTDDDCSEDKMNNLQFYLNKFPSAPDDIYIESFLKEWKNDYKKLERVHSYIQWLFPLREPGVNYMASELTKKEIEAFKKNEDAKRRLVEAYELMLGFYGIRLVNKETGEVKRAENWKERFGNLERNMHNNLRITRILKSLGELGFKHYQAPLVRFFLEETLVKKTLSNVKRSVLDYFLFAVLEKQERQDLVRFAYHHYEPKDKFVWCPRKIQKQLRKGSRNSDVGNGDDVLHSKKDGDAAVQQKEDGMNNVTKPPEGSDKIKDKSKQVEESDEPPAETETVGNGNVETGSNIENMSNGNEFPNDDDDDIDEMDQSPSLDCDIRKKEATADSEEKSTSNAKDGQDLDVMLTGADGEPEKPPKKKREDDEVPPNNDPATAAAGLVQEKAAPNKATGQTSSSVHTPLKSSKHSPSLSSEREEKIPRTDFIQPSDQKEDEMENSSASNGMQSSKDVEGQSNGTESEDVPMDSTPSSSNHNEGAS
ncbi:opioid growth factor receptor-like protein 1 [Xiphophorus maculatus]|uniref:Opioid growth factor receptor n=1 Tax=Xiphophorus maculatus TaxID=8083 RepID=A0A3B5PTW9_XIPMA|nr:opioid growth factor receptor-like protein 1 [Xiphophorus maculatus]